MTSTAPDQDEFSRLPANETGYDLEETKAFFIQLAEDYELVLSGQDITRPLQTSRTIRQKDFSPQPGGYNPVEVDQALDRVEDRFAEIERRAYISRHGLETWQTAVQELKELLQGRLQRPAQERFRRPVTKLTKGYFVKDVDALCERLIAHMEGGPQLMPADVRAAAFRAATGTMSYEETQVDAFMDRVIEYIQDTL